jgi:hypothetical protein
MIMNSGFGLHRFPPKVQIGSDCSYLFIRQRVNRQRVPEHMRPHLIVTVVHLTKPGGAVVAESALTRDQILTLNRSRKRAPNRRVSDRIVAGLCTLLIHPCRVLRCGIVLKPSPLLRFHHVLTKREYRMLFSPKRGCRPGPKGPAKELIDAVVGIKRRSQTSVVAPSLADVRTLQGKE